MRPTFPNLVALIAAEMQLTKRVTRLVLETFFIHLAEATWATGSVSIPGLGRFQTRARKGRVVVVPHRGERLHLPAHRAVRVLVAKSWRRRV